MRTAIVLFARSPEREAAEKRMRFAAPLFRALVASWLDAARRHGATPVVACAAADRDALASIAPDIEREWLEQRGATFGERAARASVDAFARGFDAIVLAAIDAPPRDLGEIFASLERGVPAISPSRDGGINCIALLAPEPDLLVQFTPRRRDLVQLCARHLAQVAIVRGTIDVDDERALAIAKRDRAWRAFFAQAPAAQPRNRATVQPGHTLHRPSRAPPANV